MSLTGKYILITGAAVRVGRAMTLAMAQAGTNVIIHYGSSTEAAQKTQADAAALGVEAYTIQADLNNSEQVNALIDRTAEFGKLFALVNNAAIFDPIDLAETDLEAWERHLRINLTAPFVLSKAFAAHVGKDREGRIVNILDWRALRPGRDHLPYTISKAGLAALTQSTAIELAPNITVNGIAFGAILPPSDGGDPEKAIADIPAGRWADLDEVGDTLRFLLDGPAYITGEIVHLDGGRHLL
ncbi:MAG: SDR family oxidoreductase [Anaerolineales bacterium]|nr:SDR family oxidoreductase [Anaerolineales bacterium]